jgi:uncharacterized membrane protein YkvI
VPAAVYQSVIVGGGYGTGREVVEFISSYGSIGGLAGVAIVTLCMFVVLAVTFESARVFKSYDYRHFFKHLLGRGWFLYEILFMTLLLIVLAVVLSAASTLILDMVGIPKAVTVIGIIAIVTWVIHFGAEFVERLLSAWAVLVSLFLVAILGLTASSHGDAIGQALATGGVEPGWWLSAGQFALYNLSIVPVLLYAVADIRTRKEAVISGAIAAMSGAWPALAMHMTFLSNTPEVLSEALPMFRIVGELAVPGLMAIYVVILLGTIVQTAIGALQGLGDRLDGWLADTKGTSLSPRGRAIMGASALVISSLLSMVGVIKLVANGYGTLAWGFLAVYILPLLTIGLWKIRNNRPGATGMPTDAAYADRISKD